MSLHMLLPIRAMCQRLVLFLGIVTVLLSSGMSCTDTRTQHQDIQQQVRLVAEPYAFDYISWELKAIYSLISKRVPGTELEEKLRFQIEEVLSENGISIFPPLNFKLEKPPHLLVISPRDRIYYLDRVMLRQNLDIDTMNRIEAEIDRSGVSSLVEELGGFGATYPPIVDSDARLTFIVDVAVEEWLHQYLAFRPLGFRYLLDSIGITQDPNIIIMNETLAGMVSNEISSQVYARYYSDEEKSKSEGKDSAFNFRNEMRQTRKNVDQLLSVGNIEGAESYMEERRQVFLAHGYQIRKLNQAYFAFHGIYGNDPASVSPIHGELKQLRARCPSLKVFLQNMSEMRSYSDLLKALNN